MGKAPVIQQAAGNAGSSSNDLSGEAIQDVMARAVEECAEAGITDPDEIREAKLAAREKFKKEMREAAEKASREATKATKDAERAAAE